MDRRNFLKNSSALSALPFLGQDGDYTRSRNKKPSFRVVFMSDIHVKDDDVSKAGMKKALTHINQLKNKPSFIINGGDSIMDALAANKENTARQWEIWTDIMEKYNRLPVYHCIGNHDVWGWQVKDESVKSDPLYDKNWAIKVLNMPGRYYSFEKSEWHFIVLDSAQENNGGYIAKIDEEQYSWLQAELNSVPKDKFICIVSHIPIISFCSAMFFDDMLPNGDWKLSRALLHTDARKLKTLFKKFPNIKACLSGHIHLQDQVTYLGVQYFCNGAISGKWWKGAFQDFDPAYALFEFHKDGTINRDIIEYEKS
jgi:3',5'-cyclic-AMP phosphodiesterase